MERDTPKKKSLYLATAAYILVFSLISLACLTDFPYVHSDESWLAGLTRAMMTQGDPGVTEPFFDAKPRYPHAVKILFHLLQAAFVSLFGYRVFSVRLLSLTAGAGMLWLCRFAAGRFLGSGRKGFLFMVLFSLDIQFLYASHFARQEILLAALQWLCLWILFSPDGFYDQKKAVFLGIATGLSVGLHPNSFLLGTMNGLCLLFGAAAGRRRLTRPLRPLFTYILVTGGLAAVFVGISLSMDSGFLSHYAAYGQAEFGTGAPIWEKFLGFFGFLSRLYQRESGTYYLPDIRPQFLLFGTGLLLSSSVAAFMRRELPREAEKAALLVTGALGVTVGMIVIGRYNQTGILFLFPFGYLAAAKALELFEGRTEALLWGVILAGTLTMTVSQAVPEIRKTDYDHYGQQLRDLVPEGAKVLGNLNGEFFFGYDCLRDYRNLPYVLEGEGLEAYLEENRIEYIIYHQELDYLWDRRPYYNVIYGNVLFVQELRAYCRESCQAVGSFRNPRYGIRVAHILDQEEYGLVTVYKRASSSSSLR
ncbi:MAG: hypothetical protein HFG75_13275 [Hungatella sp.]|nr:hypothetical protein [Hungatella sp.]